MLPTFQNFHNLVNLYTQNVLRQTQKMVCVNPGHGKGQLRLCNNVTILKGVRVHCMQGLTEGEKEEGGSKNANQTFHMCLKEHHFRFSTNGKVVIAS